MVISFAVDMFDVARAVDLSRCPIEIAIEAAVKEIHPDCLVSVRNELFQIRVKIDSDETIYTPSLKLRMATINWDLDNAQPVGSYSIND